MPKYEPTADSRIMGKNMYDMYQGLLQGGFSRDEALILLSAIMGSAVQEFLRQTPKDES